jgi:hypothetical protein
MADHEDADFAPYRPRAFRVDYEHCPPHPDWTRRLRFEVTEVWGTADRVAVGERYVVRGRYGLTGEQAYVISLACFGKAFGASAHLAPGNGAFETSTEPLDLVPDHANGFGLVLGRGDEHAMTAWITLVE